MRLRERSQRSNSKKTLRLLKIIGAILIIFLMSVPPSSSALEVPQLNARVNDYADMISGAVEVQLEQKLRAIEISDSTQVVILTIPSLEGEALEDYTIRVAQTLGIGQRKYDNGVLLFASKNDRKIRIEVGYGLEGRLTDIMAGRIIDYEIRPNFKAGRFDEGFIRGVTAIIQTVKGEYKAARRPTTRGRGRKKDLSNSVMPFIILLIIISLFGKAGRLFGAFVGALLFPIFAWMTLSLGLSLILALIPIGFILGLIAPTVFMRGAYFGSGGFGGGSGGFGGFGGGGFGGGGASGGW